MARKILSHVASLQKFFTKNLLVNFPVVVVGNDADNQITWDESDRLEHLEEALKLVLLPGHYLEFGVAEATTVNFIASKIDTNIVYGFDSFDGLPEDWTSEVSFYPAGSFKQDVIPKVANNVKLIKGLFNDTLPEFSKTIETTAFCHIDCDLYSSTKTVFDNIGHTFKSGSIIVFDEFQCVKDEHKAFVEWLSTTNFIATMVLATIGPQQVTFILKERKIQNGTKK
jgi:hypothetical protein